MRILVTGAAGFVGSRTCSHLESAGHDVIRVSDSSESGSENEFALDIASAEAFRAIEHVHEIDAIVNCAGLAHRFGRISKAEFWRVNVDGAKNVAEFAARKKVGRFVQLSSVLVYGEPRSNRPITEDQTPAPSDDYASSKLAGEIAVKEVCKASGIKLTIFRPVPIIGEGSRGNVARLIRAIDRRRFAWIGDGRNERSFVYVGDVAAAISTGLTIQAPQTFNVIGGTITVRQMVADIAKHLGKPQPAKLVPHAVARLAMSAGRPFAGIPLLGRYHRTLETWLSDAVYSGNALHNVGFVPATDVREALRREVEFYLAATGR